MPTLDQVKQTSDGWLNGFWSSLRAKQIAYTENRYFQGLACTSTPPNYSSSISNEKKPDRLDDKPAGRKDTWNQFAPSIFTPAKIPVSVECHEYLGPQGKGFVIVASFVYDDGIELTPSTWQKTIQYGPETWREQDWVDVTPE